MAIGAVDMRRSMPPKGATETLCGAFTKWTETSPSPAAISAHSPTRPTWPALRSAIAESPTALHFSTPNRTACRATVWPKPYLPSSTAMTGVSLTASAT